MSGRAPVLRIDDAGRKAAQRHIREGEDGALELQFTMNVEQWVLDLSDDINIERTPQYGR